MYHPPSRSLGKHVHRQLLCSAASTTSTTPKIRQNASRLPTVKFALLQKVQQLQRPAPEKSTIPLLCKPSSQLLLHLNFCPQLINNVKHHIVKMQHRSLIASRIWQNFTATWAAWHVDYLVSQKLIFLPRPCRFHMPGPATWPGRAHQSTLIYSSTWCLGGLYCLELRSKVTKYCPKKQQKNA